MQIPRHHQQHQIQPQHFRMHVFSLYKEHKIKGLDTRYYYRREWDMCLGWGRHGLCVVLHITHIVLHCVASSNEVYQKVAAGAIIAEIAVDGVFTCLL